MKKAFVILGTISFSALLSACNNYGHSATQPDADSNSISHSQGWAWDHKDHMRMMTEYYFNQMDTNGDGVISKKEFMRYQSNQFNQADTNHDGKLTLDEVMAQEMREKKKMKEWKMNHHDDMQQDNMQDNGMRQQNGDGSQDMGSYRQRDINSVNAPDADQGNRY